MADCLIAIGSNLGARKELFKAAIEKLGQLSDSKVIAVSKPFETLPVGGGANDKVFLNGAIRMTTTSTPFALMKHLFNIERDLGRSRSAGRWEPRTIDLDLLLFDQVQFRDPALVVPHPSMSFRRFVLEPAVEIAAEMIHPSSRLSLGALLDRLNRLPNVISIVGIPNPSELYALISDLYYKKNPTKKKVQIFFDSSLNTTKKGHIDIRDWNIVSFFDRKRFVHFEDEIKLVVIFDPAIDRANRDESTRPVEATQSFGVVPNVGASVSDSSLIELAIGFPGSTLRIESCDFAQPETLERAAIEIYAAIEAMQPLDDSITN